MKFLKLNIPVAIRPNYNNNLNKFAIQNVDFNYIHSLIIENIATVHFS